MSTMKITLIGFSNYLEAKNDDLFKYLSVPAGIDKDLLINTILLRGGEFESLYSDPYFIQNMIGVWSSKWMHTMERWIKALSIDYNPLENYDRIENWVDNTNKFSEENALKNAASHSVNNDSQQRNETAVAQDKSISTGSGSTENKRSSFDASDYQPHDKTETSSSGENTSNGITSANGKTEMSGATSNINSEAGKNTDSEFANSVHGGRTHGNIGVTTSQQMLKSELDIAKWNLYEEIADLFVNEFCIYLY